MAISSLRLILSRRTDPPWSEPLLWRRLLSVAFSITDGHAVPIRIGISKSWNGKKVLYGYAAARHRHTRPFRRRDGLLEHLRKSAGKYQDAHSRHARCSVSCGIHARSYDRIRLLHANRRSVGSVRLGHSFKTSRSDGRLRQRTPGSRPGLRRLGRLHPRGSSD